MLERVDIDLVFWCRHRGAHRPGTNLEQIGATREHLLFCHPDHVALELIGNARRLFRSSDHVTTRDVDLVSQAEGHGHPSLGLVEVTVSCHYPADGRSVTRWHHPDCVADSDDPSGNLTGVAPEVEVRAIDPLHWHAQRTRRALIVDVDGLKVTDERGPRVPRCVL